MKKQGLRKLGFAKCLVFSCWCKENFYFFLVLSTWQVLEHSTQQALEYSSWQVLEHSTWQALEYSCWQVLVHSTQQGSTYRTLAPQSYASKRPRMKAGTGGAKKEQLKVISKSASVTGLFDFRQNSFKNDSIVEGRIFEIGISSRCEKNVWTRMSCEFLSTIEETLSY